MKPYRDIDGDSGISHYDDGPGWIRLQFKNGRVWVYKESRIGAENLATMKRLAASGDGLNAFLNKTPRVKDNGESV